MNKLISVILIASFFFTPEEICFSKYDFLSLHVFNLQEIEELDRKLEHEMLRKESAQQQHLMSRQSWTLDGLGLSSEAVETNADRQVTVLLRQAMNKYRQFINLHQQR